MAVPNTGDQRQKRDFKKGYDRRKTIMKRNGILENMNKFHLLVQPTVCFIEYGMCILQYKTAHKIFFKA